MPIREQDFYLFVGIKAQTDVQVGRMLLVDVVHIAPIVQIATDARFDIEAHDVGNLIFDAGGNIQRKLWTMFFHVFADVLFFCQNKKSCKILCADITGLN